MANYMDFDVSVFIITSDRQYIPAGEYDNRLDGEGAFIMLTNDELNTEFGDDNSICIYRDWSDEINKAKDGLKDCIEFPNTYSVSCLWQTGDSDIPNTFKLNRKTDDIGDFSSRKRDECVRKYLDGHRTNQEVMRNVTSILDGRSMEEFIPAIMVAHHTRVTSGGRVLCGYLPAIGQMLFIMKNILILNSALRKIDKRVKLFEIDPDRKMKGNWWSANEYNNEDAWYVDGWVPLSDNK